MAGKSIMSSLTSTFDRRKFLKTLTVTTGALAAPSVLRAAPANLIFSSWLAPPSPVRQNLFEVWADEIPSITDGRVEVTLLQEALAPPPGHLGLLRENKADIAYALHGYSPGEFQRSQIGQFSFLGDAYSASHAFSKVYGQLLDAEKEHTGMELLGLFQHGPGVLMLKDKRVESPEDYRGLRIRTSGGYIGNLIEDLGGTHVPMSPTAVRQAFIDGIIDGVAFPYEGAVNFNIADQITFISEIPNGYYNATWFLGLSQEAASRIEERDLAAIKEFSAQTVHVLAAKTFDYVDYVSKEELEAGGIEILKASPEVIGHIKGLASNYEQQWAEALTAEGYDGARALAFTRRMTNGE